MICATSDFISSLQQRGVKLWSENGSLRFRTPSGALSPEELNELRRLKCEIIKLVEERISSNEFPLQQRPADCPVPLTPLQRRWWRYDLSRGSLSRRDGTYPVRIVGPFNPSLLERCLNRMVNRHESLRTRFVMVEGDPRQEVDAPKEQSLEIVDLSTICPTLVNSQLMRRIDEFVGEKVDLSAGRMFDAKLFKLSDLEHVLMLALPAINTDDISNEIISREIWTLYREAARGSELTLPTVPLQFGDYAVWQQRISGAWLTEHAAYWKRRLTGAPPVKIPLESSLSEVEQPVGAVADMTFGPLLSERLRDIARRQRVLLAIVVLTIYVVGMARWSQQRDLVITFIYNGRFRRELQGVVGFVVNPLYLRIELNKMDTLADLVEQVNREFYAALDHLDFGWVLDLVPELFTELYFNWTPGPWGQFPTNHPRQVDDKTVIQPFPFTVTWPGKLEPYFHDTAGEIGGRFVHRPDIFSSDVMGRFCLDLRLVAQQFADNPLCRVALLCS